MEQQKLKQRYWELHSKLNETLGEMSKLHDQMDNDEDYARTALFIWSISPVVDNNSQVRQIKAVCGLHDTLVEGVRCLFGKDEYRKLLIDAAALMIEDFAEGLKRNQNKNDERTSDSL